jgi:hypothetical protein
MTRQEERRKRLFGMRRCYAVPGGVPTGTRESGLLFITGPQSFACSSDKKKRLGLTTDCRFRATLFD